MTPRPQKRIAWGLALAFTPVFAQTQSGPPAGQDTQAKLQKNRTPQGWKQFTSVAGGYIAYYPEPWQIFLLSGQPNLDIVNFPPSQRVRAVILPANGARIYVGPPPEGIATIAQWIDHDIRADEVESKNSVILRSANSKEPLTVTEVVSQSLEGQESVACYVNISGRLLVGRVTYWKGDSNATQHRQVLHRVMESIRPLARYR